jgi:hypothetical protein
MSRHAGWVAAAVVVLASVVLGLVAPASWWGVTFVVGLAALMVLLRGVVPESYRPGWTRSTVIVLLLALCGGGSYAFGMEPWGPVPRVAGPLFVLFLFGLIALVADASRILRGGPMSPESVNEAEALRVTRNRGFR